MKQGKSVKQGKRSKRVKSASEDGTVKRSRRGRPRVPKSARKGRYSVSLSAKQAQSITALGKGSLSAGVQRLVRRYISKRSEAQSA